MSGAIQHHRALGVHLGAFVQPSPPSTADVQDGVLWLDTSSGPPYQLKRWDAGASVWHPVQMDTTGYPLPLGDRLEEYSVGGVANPLDPPTLSAVAASFNLWPAGTYHFAYTWEMALLTGGTGHTRLSPAAGITVDGTQWIRVCKPAFPSGFPTGLYRGTNWYLVDPLPPVGDVWTGFQTRMTAGDCYTLANLTDPDSAQPPTENTTGHVAVRLVKADGDRYWDHDGSTLTVQTDGDVIVLKTPLPDLSAAPSTLVGKDPVSGLPSFCPPPNPRLLLAAEQQDIERPNPTGMLTCVQITCGVATALRDELYQTYSTMRSIINAGLNSLGGALGSLLIDTGTAFFVALTDGLDIELAVPLRNALDLILKAVPGITGSVLQAGFADLNSDQKEWLRQTCWCALSCADNQVTLTQQMMIDWQTVVAADTVMLSGIQRDALAALIQYGGGVGLGKWSQVAQTGAGFPFHDCDAYSCP